MIEKIFEEARYGNKEALYELEALAEKDDAEALERLAEIYLNSEGGIETDGYKAIEYFSKAEAWFDIALIFQEGKAGIKRDLHKAIEYYMKADDKSSIEELTAIMNSAEQLPQPTDEFYYSELARRYRGNRRQAGRAESFRISYQRH